MRSTLLIISIFFLRSFLCYADLTPIDIKTTLSSKHNTYAKGEVIPFTLKFQNKSKKHNVILLPGSLHEGKKLVYFSYYSVKNNFYTEVARESREIDMDSTYYSQVDLRNIAPNDSISIPIFLNEHSNYRKHIEAHHLLPDLAPGTYQVLAWYDPWDEEFGNTFYNKISSFPKQNDQEFAPNKFNIPEEGLISNYFTIHISKEKSLEKHFTPNQFCDKNCKYCTAIEKGDWKKVANIIDKQTYYKGKNSAGKTSTNWLQTHRNVAWVYNPPQAILASLPTYTYRNMIFKNTKGYHYFSATWQIGIVYPNRSRIKSFFAALRNIFFISDFFNLPSLSESKKLKASSGVSN